MALSVLCYSVFRFAMTKCDILFQTLTGDGIVVNNTLLHEVDRNLPPKKTLDSLALAFANPNIKKIVIRKLDDFKDGDLF